jgi:hypothetical protein
MFQVTIELGKLTDWLALTINSLVFISGLVVLWLARANLKTFVKQMRSQSQHQVMEAHKTLYMPLIQDDQLSALVFGSNPKVTKAALMASMIINHSSRVHSDYENGIFSQDYASGLAANIAGIFRLPAIAERWKIAKLYHRPSFVAFVEKAVQASINAEMSHPDPLFGQSLPEQAAPEQRSDGSESAAQADELPSITSPTGFALASADNKEPGQATATPP